MKNTKKEYNVIASRLISNNIGIELVELTHDIDDYIKYRHWTMYNGYGKVTKSRIRYDINGNPYFNFRGGREYLCHYIRA